MEPQIFGEDEKIYGYRDLVIDVSFDYSHCLYISMAAIVFVLE
jgi:hypothetical protein